MVVFGFTVLAIRVSGMLHDHRRGCGMIVRVVMLVPSILTMTMTMSG
jgi:hypothetical protein